MKINYQNQLDALITGLTDRPKLLLHSCCGPCSSYVTEYLTRYFDLTVLYFNPNIDPSAEYLRRLDTQKSLLDATGWAALIPGEYDHHRFLEAIRGLESQPEGGARCAVCFRLRLEETARLAKAMGFPIFGTTLTVSPHKNAPLINEIGQEIAGKYGVVWLPSDFKKREGYKRSIQLSKEYALYRQDYCGCEFSSHGSEHHTEKESNPS